MRRDESGASPAARTALAANGWSVREGPIRDAHLRGRPLDDPTPPVA